MQKSHRALAYRYAHYWLRPRALGSKRLFYLWLVFGILKLAQFIWLGRSWSDALVAFCILFLAYDDWLWRGVREVFAEQAQPAQEGAPELSPGLQK